VIPFGQVEANGTWERFDHEKDSLRVDGSRCPCSGLHCCPTSCGSLARAFRPWSRRRIDCGSCHWRGGGIICLRMGPGARLCVRSSLCVWSRLCVWARLLLRIGLRSSQLQRSVKAWWPARGVVAELALLSPSSVIASEAKQSRMSPREEPGLLRRVRSSQVTAGAAIRA
jgi:hypothetical protein